MNYGYPKIQPDFWLSINQFLDIQKSVEYWISIIRFMDNLKMNYGYPKMNYGYPKMNYGYPKINSGYP